MRAEEAARRALAAVARLTILAGAAGCAGNVVVDGSGSTGPADPGEATPNEPPEATVEVPNTDCFDGAFDASACCGALLSEAFADGAVLSDPTLATDEEKACCELAVGTMDAWAGQDATPFDYGIVSGCCGAELVEDPWNAHPSCTPWGPPMPPAMPHPFDLEAAA